MPKRVRIRIFRSWPFQQAIERQKISRGWRDIVIWKTTVFFGEIVQLPVKIWQTANFGSFQNQREISESAPRWFLSKMGCRFLDYQRIAPKLIPSRWWWRPKSAHGGFFAVCTRVIDFWLKLNILLGDDVRYRSNFLYANSTWYYLLIRTKIIFFCEHIFF